MPLLAPRTAAGLRSNLRRVRPKASEAEIRALARKCFGTYGRYWAESFRLPYLSPQAIDNGFEIIGYQHLVAARDSGLGPIMVLPHVGGWEWAAAWLGLVADMPVTVVAEKLEPEDVFEWFRSLRQSLGMRIIPLGDGSFGPLIRAVKDNHVVCLLADRDIGGNGVTVQFFAEETTLPAGPALLARRTGAALLPTAVYFRGNKRVCHIGEPIRVDDSLPLKQALAEATQEVARKMQSLIEADPGQWHVLQPIWTS